MDRAARTLVAQPKMGEGATGGGPRLLPVLFTEPGTVEAWLKVVTEEGVTVSRRVVLNIVP